MGANTAFTVSEMVYLPATRVWVLLTDWTAAPLWMPGVTQMSAEGPTQLGVAIDYVSAGHERTASITAVEHGRSITFTTGQGDIRADYRYDLAADGDDTRLTLTADVVVSPELSGLADQVREGIAEADGAQLADFKRYAEAAP